MYSKKYMYDAVQNTCIKLIEDGYVLAFEEILNLMSLNKTVRKDAESGHDKIMPKYFHQEPEVLHYIEHDLKNAEEAIRKDKAEDNYRIRMELGKHFHEREGYHWLAVYFYKSNQTSTFGASSDVQLYITSLHQQALLEETRGNIDTAVKYLERALKMIRKNGMNDESSMQKTLNENVCRMYMQLGSNYLEKEEVDTAVKDSASVRFFKKAAKIALASDDLEIQAACQALLGKAMMKFNDDEMALKSFEKYLKLCQEDNKYGLCQGHFAISEIFKRSGNLEKSTEALHKCQDIAKEYNSEIPFIFSAISLGQIETAKRQYLKANECFKAAYNAVMTLNEDYEKKTSLKKLSKIMYGIGRAHLTFHKLINTLRSPTSLCMAKLLSWRSRGGSFTGEVIEQEDHLINLDEVERDNKEAEITEVIEKLIKHELNQQ